MVSRVSLYLLIFVKLLIMIWWQIRRKACKNNICRLTSATLVLKLMGRLVLSTKVICTKSIFWAASRACAGESLTLTCEAGGSPPPTVTWWRGHSLVGHVILVIIINSVRSSLRSHAPTQIHHDTLSLSFHPVQEKTRSVWVIVALIFMLLLSRNYVCRVDPSISN